LEISYTKLNSFFHCEYLYYLRYIKRVKLQESSATAFGTSVHETIKIAYDNDLSGDEMAEVFKKQWVSNTNKKDILFYYDGEFIKKYKSGQEIVKNYYSKFMLDKPKPLATEYFFGRNQGIKIGKHVIIGVIDQIDADNNVIDYKTGRKPTQQQLDFDLQFTMYSIAHRQLFGKKENGLILRHLGTMKDICTYRDDEDFELLAGEIDKVESKLRGKAFVRNLSRECGNCFFLEECLGKQKKMRSW